MVNSKSGVFNLKACSAGLVGALLCSASIAGIQNKPQQPFQSGIDVATLYMIAVDKSGNGVRDLVASDLILTVDGKRRPIRSLDLVSLTVPQIERPIRSDGSLSVSRQFSRSFVFVIFHDHIRAGNEHPFTTAAADFVKLLQPADRVAVVTLPQGRIELNLNEDRERLSAVLGAIKGHSHDPVPAGTCHESSALRDFLEGLEQVGGPKYVILLSEGLSYCAGESSRQQLRAIGEAAERSNSFITVVRPHNMPVDASVARRSGVDSQDRYRTMWDQGGALRDLAGVTNGDYFELSGAADGVLDAVERRTRGAYLLAFDTVEGDLRRSIVDVSLKIQRKAVEIRSPSQLKLRR